MVFFFCCLPISLFFDCCKKCKQRRTHEEDMLNASGRRNEEAKRAGQILYRSTTLTSSSSLSTSNGSARHYRDINSGSSGMSAWMPDTGKMSPVRRTFCLFVTFDLILTFILWVIYTQLIGETPVWHAFSEQVANFTIKDSLFDTVMLAAVRFTFLLLGYALFRLNHWWVIALSTLITCAYLLVKCFMYDFAHHNSGQNPLSYVVLIISFVLAWAETWFLDFKVIPEEKKHRRRLQERSQIDERTPLIRDTERASLSGEENIYYSPIDTPEGSDDETGHRHSRGHSRQQSCSSRISILSITEQENFIKMGQNTVDTVLEMYNLPESDWKAESGTTLEGGIVQSKYFKDYGRKVFRLKAQLDFPAKQLWEELIYNIQDSPSWNPTILEARTLETLDNNTEVTYQISSEAVGGIVASRDFVGIRRWEFRDGCYFSCLCNATYEDMPPQKKYVRGENDPGGMVIIEDPEDPSQTLLTWFVNTNLKGWLPQKAIEQGLSGFVLDYFKYLKKRCEDLKEAQMS